MLPVPSDAGAQAQQNQMGVNVPLSLGLKLHAVLTKPTITKKSQKTQMGVLWGCLLRNLVRAFSWLLRSLINLSLQLDSLRF